MKYLFCAVLFLFAACKKIDTEGMKEQEDIWRSNCAKSYGGNMYWRTDAALSEDRTLCYATVRRDYSYCKSEVDYRTAAEKMCALLGTHFDCRAESYFNEGDNMTITYECYAISYAE